MQNAPNWLPNMANVSPWQNGGANDTYEMLYDIFCRDIKISKLTYNCYDVWIFSTMEDGKETLFWHLTSRKQKAQPVPRRKRKFYVSSEIPAQRYPDLRRSERLPWIKPIIENANKIEVLAWDYQEGDGSIKTYLWLKDFDYVVIMKKYPDNKRRLITSFYIDSRYKYADFERKYRDRIV